MEELIIKRRELINIVKKMSLEPIDEDENEAFCFFLRCCESGNLELCQICKDAGLDINIRHKLYGDTLLAYFSRSKKFTPQISDWLIENGANINYTSYYSDSTLLYELCNHGNIDTAKYFIKKGINITQNDLKAAIDHSKLSGNIELVDLLFKAKPDLRNNIEYLQNEIIFAIKYKYYHILEYLLENGLSPNFYFKGYTPLHLAAVAKDKNAAQILLHHKADVNAKLQDNCKLVENYLAITPADIAKYIEDSNMLQLLNNFGGHTTSKEEKINAILEFDANKRLASIIEKVLTS